MTLNRLDAAGLPAPGIERALAHHFLGRPNPLCKNILYALVGGPRRYSELAPLLGGRSKNKLTDALALLEAEDVVVRIHDARTKPPTSAYRLSGTGLLVVDWMRRFEFLEELQAASPHRRGRTRPTAAACRRRGTPCTRRSPGSSSA